MPEPPVSNQTLALQARVALNEVRSAAAHLRNARAALNGYPKSAFDVDALAAARAAPDSLRGLEALLALEVDRLTE